MPLDSADSRSLPQDRYARGLELDPWDPMFRVLILSGVLLAMYASLRWQVVFRPLLHAGDSYPWAGSLLRPSLGWIAMGSVLLLFRTLLWFRYRTPPVATHADAPTMTVVIPAYNEGAMVAQSIDSVASARYPRERLEILVIDDGSRDDTWVHIQAAAARHPGLVHTLRFTENCGKRAALEAGFRRARGEVLVSIDSDSIIPPEALLAIAGPFRDPGVGAVAGRVAVHNPGYDVIPRMLQVRYTLSFDYLRAVQSTYGTVYCCPGALAAYRSSVVQQVLDSWSRQRFLGVACTYGEDRAMTNYILKEGYDTVYQRAAVVHTAVPRTYWKLCKMFLRWDRSYVREEIRFASIVWKRPWKSRLIALVDSCLTNLRYPVGWAALAVVTVLTVHHPVLLLRLLCAIGLMSGLNMLYYLRSERSWNWVYGVLYAYFSVFCLSWIFPYAVVTVRSRGWLTR